MRNWSVLRRLGSIAGHFVDRGKEILPCKNIVHFQLFHDIVAGLAKNSLIEIHREIGVVRLYIRLRIAETDAGNIPQPLAVARDGLSTGGNGVLNNRGCRRQDAETADRPN